MDEPEPTRQPGLLHRKASRRALLGGAAAVAAGGTAVAVVGLATQTSAGQGKSSTAAPSATALATSTPAEDLSRPIEDPKVRAAHLLRRAAWGGSKAQVDEFAALSREEAADRLLNFASVDNSALNARIEAAQFNLTTPGRGLDGKRPPQIRDIQRWWLTRMAYTARPLEERMTYIWHGLLTSQLSQVGPQRAKWMVTQNELFRSHALARYDDLLQAVSKDPAMMTYLNTVESSKEHPNENYPRELMELFSMGEGNYTEDDVRESARAFTGWRLTSPAKERPPEGLSEKERDEWLNQMWASYEPQWRAAPAQHDNGSKTFLGKTGNWDGTDIVRIIMEQPATGRFITKRLFSEFAYRDPDEATLDRLLDVWNSSDHDAKAVVRAILVSDEFYSMRAYRSLVRSPIEFIVGAVRGLELEADFLQLEQTAAAMDQRLFEPPNVAGWPGGEVWLSSGTFFGRVNFADSFLRKANRPGPVPAIAGYTNASDLVNGALDLLVDGNVRDEARQAITDYAASITNLQDRAAAVAYLVLCSPEYQLI